MCHVTYVYMCAVTCDKVSFCDLSHIKGKFSSIGEEVFRSDNSMEGQLAINVTSWFTQVDCDPDPMYKIIITWC